MQLSLHFYESILPKKYDSHITILCYKHWSSLMHKVCGCYWLIVTFVNWTHVFNWCVFRWELKNKHHKDTCWENIGLCLSTLINYFKLTELTRPIYLVKEWRNMHFWSSQLNQLRSGFWYGSHWCFIVDLLMQNNFGVVNMIKPRWWTR